MFILTLFLKNGLGNEDEFFKQLVLSKLELFEQENANLKKDLNVQNEQIQTLQGQLYYHQKQ